MMMVTKKLKFLWQNWFDSATVTASSEATDYGVSKLQNRWKTWDWRSTGLTAEWVKANLGSAKAIKAFAFENMNLTTGAIVKLQGHTADVWTSPAYELSITITSTMVAEKRIIVFLPAAQTYQWWRLLMTDASNPAGYISASRIYLGPRFEPDSQCSGGWTRYPTSDSEISRSLGGQKTAVKRTKRWVYELPISIVGQTDADGFEDMDDECGIDTPLWICLDSTDEISSTIYACFLEYIAFPSTISGVLWETNLRFEEEL